MSDFAFTLSDADFVARSDGTLWWPSKRLLCVSDLHLGKSERIARRGGTLLPPYETRETLWRLDAAITATDPSCVICLGDSFDDLTAAENVSDDARKTLTQLQAGRDWIWIEGNHDAGPVDIGGTHRGEVVVDGITFRHITDKATRGEISGHYHPKAGLSGLSQRACFLLDKTKLILPAFGAYTGGLSVRDPVLSGLFDPTGLAILTGKTALAVPISACLKR
ncbi:ligase-associated DNA damage response endonuclease PdeM [Octadecabacter sp. 1_MG-2023]|uniref:ligase-associated DNA damage response endonuclease PdeM n=1 Tax=unclassified Octadecabacter TaxID=196158 RepID=UPI001C08461E|nr:MULTISPECIES: ligase-associated DNA damage response endonuclease PdeM [unclassified Octadecabacter]MBU2991988.1 ligase-associated DNA damage response endonuclease PdeM [Octadecabacter sp. B2R22]MDO6735962.1 ligase-associated DNA damage response endonuclease PdeM [Octadecabacter sp. 1_MG-2023]